jgi:hypothetical protein
MLNYDSIEAMVINSSSYACSILGGDRTNIGNVTVDFESHIYHVQTISSRYSLRRLSMTSNSTYIRL